MEHKFSSLEKEEIGPENLELGNVDNKKMIKEMKTECVSPEEERKKKATTEENDGGNAKCNDDNNENTMEDEDCHAGGPVFNPPLYLQRYTRVAQILAEYDVKKVVDFGCAECRLQKYLRDIETVEEVACVDLDPEVVERFKHKICPDTSDYVFKRKLPLVVRLFEGNVAEFDSRLAHYDAVTMVELIEHLDTDTLDNFSAALFGAIRPMVAIITTPNAEFNTLFPDFSGFRHPDHKFEWTRAQFQEWGDGVASLHGYTVTYSGVGDPTPGNEHLGHCSQIATFVRKAEEKTVSEDMSTPYRLVKEHIFPHKEEVVDSEEEIVLEAEYYMRAMVRGGAWAEEGDSEPEARGEDYYAELPLQKLLKFKAVSRSCDDDVTKLKTALGNHGYDFSSDGDSVRYLVECYHSDGYHSDADDAGDGCFGDEGGREDGCDGEGGREDGCPGNVPSDECWYIPGQFSDAEDDVTVAIDTRQYGKVTQLDNDQWE